VKYDPSTADPEQLSLAPGEARCPGPDVHSVIGGDDVPPDFGLYAENYVYDGSQDIPTFHYTSQEYHQQEVEQVWRKVWQVACRVEDVQKPGDVHVYDIADDSLIIVRDRQGRIRAFYNACLHRGTALREEPGNITELRCPFHGFCWSLEGQATEIVCQWDFPHIDPATFSLPQARVEEWGGFVFVCMDDETPSLVDFIGAMPKYFHSFPLEERYTSARVSKVMKANWKVALEAFIESFHVIRTHPQVLSYVGDANSQYDNFGSDGHFNRMLSLKAVPSPHVADYVTPEETFHAARETYGWDVDVEPDPSRTARSQLAEYARRELVTRYGPDVERATDSDVLDTLQYFLFPNFIPWAGLGMPLMYRFRPNGNDPDTSIMDVWLLHPFEGERPEPAPLTVLDAETSWTAATELGGLGPIFDQDASNMPLIQKGLKATRRKGVVLANYQESRIRHFHRLLERYIGS
jgi:phenylpropionate dioxygenase-like ring-hydroxylating dioxygenase large terminal subunit